MVPPLYPLEARHRTLLTPKVALLLFYQVHCQLILNPSVFLEISSVPTWHPLSPELHDANSITFQCWCQSQHPSAAKFGLHGGLSQSMEKERVRIQSPTPSLITCDLQQVDVWSLGLTCKVRMIMTQIYSYKDSVRSCIDSIYTVSAHQVGKLSFLSRRNISEGRSE